VTVLLTGATGFTGSYVLEELLKAGHKVRCFVRPERKSFFETRRDVETFSGNLEDPDSLTHALRGMDALLNLASLGFGHAPGIVRAATEARLGRFVCISTTAVFTTLYARSKIVRKEAEQAVMSSGLRYTIIRPTMIFGSSKDRNISRLIRYVIRHRILPVAGAGQSKQQPVYVQDLAGAIVSALDSDKAVSRAYNVSGERAITFSEMVDTIGTLTGRRVKMIHIPYRPIVKTLGVLEAIGFQLPLKAEQIERLNEDKVFDHEDAVKDLAYRPRTFEEAIRLELAEMGVRSR
jgi:uncharacterized protein YbjT (DUF2867 family)